LNEPRFGRSLLDTPHRLNATGTLELPFGEGKRWLNGRGLTNALFGGVGGDGGRLLPERLPDSLASSGLPPIRVCSIGR
jgi:hypothetical protein